MRATGGNSLLTNFLSGKGSEVISEKDWEGAVGRRFDEKEDMKQRAGNGEPAARERMQHCLPAGRAPSKVMVVNFNRALRVPAAVS